MLDGRKRSLLVGFGGAVGDDQQSGFIVGALLPDRLDADIRFPEGCCDLGKNTGSIGYLEANVPLGRDSAEVGQRGLGEPDPGSYLGAGEYLASRIDDVAKDRSGGGLIVEVRFPLSQFDTQRDVTPDSD